MAVPDAQQRTDQIVFTNKARCRDCYRCLRACPVKAIRVVDGQAFVEADRCIACGTCIRECPQQAKTFRNDVERAVRLIASGSPVAASVGPSFAACFEASDWMRLPEALRRLGFMHVGETAVGAYAVAKVTAEYAGRTGGPQVCTACPAVVSYVEHYEADMAPCLVPVASPMMAHAKALRERFGPEVRVVFIGPCVAKKAEAERSDVEGLVDCVLTFSELLEWFERAGLVLKECTEGAFDEEPPGDARFFPVPGGLARTGAMQTDLFATKCVAVSGVTDLRDVLESVRQTPESIVIEPLFCPHGCVNGPGMPQKENTFTRRGRLLEFAAHYHGGAMIEAVPVIPPLKPYEGRPIDADRVSEAAIVEVLAATGKSRPEDQLNCGACGYDSCREKAVAVVRGMAVPEMCIPRMRRLAEQRSDRIMETTPNGVVVLDQHLVVIYMNGAFRRMFQCTEGVIGKPIAYLMDPEPFERLAGDGGGLLEFTARHEKYNLICHQLLYPLADEKQYVGIFVNVTNTMSTQEKLKRLRSETLRKAQELLEHQVQAAQEMAQFLGESTARSEELVRNIQSMASEKPKLPGDHWLWDTDQRT